MLVPVRSNVTVAPSFALWLVLLFLGTAADAQPDTACRPCAGIVVDDLAATARLAASSDSTEDAPLILGQQIDLSEASALPSNPSPGVVPFLQATFRTEPPLLANSAQFDREIERLAEAVRATATGTSTEGSSITAYVQLRWEPAGQQPGEGTATATELAYLIKRAAVAVTGASTDASVFLGPMVLEEGFLRTLYGEDVAAYVDGLSITPDDVSRLESLSPLLSELDAGVGIAVDSVPLSSTSPAGILEAVARTAELGSAGASLVLFDLPQPSSQDLTPFRLLAAEFRGDLSPDPYSRPEGAEAWSFVRGEDLALRVVVEVPPGATTTTLRFSDPQLRSPVLIDASTGERRDLYGGARTRRGYRLDVEQPPPVFMLAFERMSAAELAAIEGGPEGVEERLEVASERQMPVAEILRRLQAFEDAQQRKLESYTAVNAMSLRFQLGTGVQSLDTTFEGRFFYAQGQPFDWAWERLYVNGVRWRNKRLPEIPLIQPEKAAALPVEINFTRQYRYRLRGTARVEGRDCWVVDFEPAGEVSPEDTLWQGTVWVDREIYARVKTRAVQLGLEGDVVSNEETTFFTPLDGDGQPAAWSPESYMLPLRLVGQQIFSILNVATVVEREVTLTAVEINPPNFEERRQAVLASESTMVRDTDEGLRYLVEDEETGERVVQDELDPSRLFIVGGVFWDESQDFPIPLAGINWISFDFLGKGGQANLFWGGPLVIGNLATPSLFGSKWEAGVDIFGLAIAGTDTLYRDGSESINEDVETLRPNIDLAIGRPLGSFWKAQLEYSLGFNSFSRADDTSPEFVLPEDHLDHQFTARLLYNRAGYRFRLFGTRAIRSDWEPWGLPGNVEFDQEQDEYTTWGAALGKTWHLPKFTKFGAEIEYVGGENLDRFSQYQFGFFSDVRVHGYRSELIRAEEAVAAHLSYGVNIADIFRIDLLGDVAIASNDTTGLDEETLAGVGIAGTFIGPWRTVVNIDIGVPVAGPDDGVSAFIAFLKLFK